MANLTCIVFFLRKSITGTLLAIRELIKYTAQRLLCITFLFVFAVIGVGLQKKLQSQGVISEAAVRDGGKVWYYGLQDSCLNDMLPFYMII